MAIILNGKELSSKIRESLKQRIKQFKEKKGFSPGLSVILVGNDPGSKIYVKNKRKFSEEVGINSKVYELPADTTEDKLEDLIERLNEDRSVHGILLQLPLPSHLKKTKFINMINPLKDVDGFHIKNMGLLASGTPQLVPCTPLGIIKICEEYNIPLKGADVTIIGRSNIVGKPLALLMILRDATVTVCHSKTRNIEAHSKKADILVAATGKARIIKRDWVKKGAVVIDVGISRTEEGKIVGDVDFEEVKEVASHITPVPGGVGPMTVAMLLENTLKAAELQT